MRALKGCFGLIVVIVILAAAAGKQSPKANERKSPTAKAPTPVFVTFTASPKGGDFVRTIKVSVTPSATITDTPVVSTETEPAAQPTEQAVVNAVPAQITPRSPSSYYVRSQANARSCPNTTCDKIGQFQPGEYIVVDGIITGGEFKGSKLWYHTSFNGQEAYVHTTLVIEAALISQPTLAQLVGIEVQPTSPSTGFVCPRNCDEAIAMGLSEAQAGTCSNLDRDDDHKACYGD